MINIDSVLLLLFFDIGCGCHVDVSRLRHSLGQSLIGVLGGVDVEGNLLTLDLSLLEVLESGLELEGGLWLPRLHRLCFSLKERQELSFLFYIYEFLVSKFIESSEIFVLLT